ncbi:MAG: hypothetical protein WC842_04195 [Candidatus Paceibacterota bacterium]|jgi:archaellum component FlaC
MDNATKLFKSIKESQIHKIKDEFDNGKKCAEDAINELSDLSEEIKKLQKNNTTTEFLDVSKKIQEELNDTIKHIYREGFSPR